MEAVSLAQPLDIITSRQDIALLLERYCRKRYLFCTGGNCLAPRSGFAGCLDLLLLLSKLGPRDWAGRLRTRIGRGCGSRAVMGAVRAVAAIGGAASVFKVHLKVLTEIKLKLKITV